MSNAYQSQAPERTWIDSQQGALILEFGTDWCEHCRAAQPLIEAALGAKVTHLKIEDGKGRRLGRSFGVKLWPTLIFMRDGVEVARLVRPGSRAEIEQALQSAL